MKRRLIDRIGHDLALKEENDALSLEVMGQIHGRRKNKSPRPTAHRPNDASTSCDNVTSLHARHVNGDKHQS